MNPAPTTLAKKNVCDSMTSRMLKEIPDEATLRQLQTGLKCAIDISYQFVETGVHAPVITIWDSMTPAQETILDLILAEYIW